MAKYNNQKAKVLFLQQMMYETGENHTISMQEIIDRLQDKGIRAERKSIYDDMEALRFFGMDIQYRRERPSGYYLANKGEMMTGNIAVSASSEEKSAETEARQAENTSADAAKASDNGQQEISLDTVEKDPGQERAWMQSPKETGSGKQMKLVCSESGKSAVQEFFGGDVSFKFRDGADVAVVPLRDDKVFFGWITAMGDDVQILKPKKVSQAYRDYLKQLSRRYKTDK